jgi:flagellar biogenesis protein FliO
VNPTFVLSKIQQGGQVIMLGKWWQVLLVLIVFIVGAVWLIMRVSRRKPS